MPKRKRSIKGGGGLSRDATVSRRPEEALRESEERFRKAFQSSPVGIVMTRLSDNHIVDVNDALLRVWGYTREEVAGRTAEDLNVWVNPEDRLNIIQTLRENKPVSMFEAQFRRKSGELAWGILSATLVDIGGEPHLMVQAQDVTERKRAEETLRMAIETMRTLVTASPSAIICIDMKGRATVWNSAAERIFGWTAREVIGKPLPVIPSENAKEAEVLRQRAFQGETVTGCEVRRLRKDGSLIDVSVAFGPVHDRQGRVIGVVSVITDITERKRNEEALRKTQDSLRQSSEILSGVISAAPVAVVALDHDGRLTLWNQAAERMYGWKAEEVIGHLPPYIPDDRREEYALLRKRLLEGEAIVEYEATRRKKNGDLIEVSLSSTLLRDARGEIIGTMGFQVDITERKRSEEKLNRTTAQLNALVQSSPVAIFGLDMERRVTTWSPAAERMYGWSAQEVMGKPIPTIPEDRREEYEVLRQRSLRGEPPVDYETRRLRKDGSQIDVSLSTAPLRDAGGDIVGTMGVHVDISDRVRAEEKQRASANALRKTLFSTIEVICKIVEARDPYTSGHEERVGALAMAIAHEMGLSEDRIEGVRVAAAIHDIGKLHVPIEILSRPGKLSDAEFAIIKTHPQVGYDILSGFEFPWPIAIIAHQHHERMDGSGYPNALRGDDILLEARVLTVADVVESMSSHRPYRPAHTLEESLAEIEQHRGTRFDPMAVDACLKLFREKGYKLE